jgi:hypothetical protein
MQICIGAVHVLTITELGIGPEKHPFWAFEHGAETFLICTCVQVLFSTGSVLTIDVSSIGLFLKAWARVVCVAHCNGVAAPIAVNVMTSPRLTMDIFCIQFLNIVLWALVGNA